MERYENTFMGLLDISFSRFVTESVVKILYVVAVVLAGIFMLVGIIGAFLNYGVSQGIGALILAPVVLFVIVVFIRILFEIFIVIFRIADYLKIIAENSG
jgi:hypothetical protein